jgi:hypothetical protein
VKSSAVWLYGPEGVVAHSDSGSDCLPSDVHFRTKPHSVTNTSFRESGKFQRIVEKELKTEIYIRAMLIVVDVSNGFRPLH